MMLLYSIALAAALLAAAPWWMFRMMTTERYRQGLGQRLGSVPTALREAVRERNVVWLHAVSVGEVLAASRLVQELEAALGDGSRVVISTTTRTGQALAQKRFGEDRVFYFPLDFAFSVRAYLRALNPRALVLMESELWPRMLHECSARGIAVAVVNARMSDRSFARTKKFQKPWARMARNVRLWLAQSEGDARRIASLSGDEQRVHVAGNLKYDVRAPEQSRVTELMREVAGERKIVVAGSTLGENPPEDSLLMRAQQSFSEESRPLLVLAPRKPETFGAISSMVAMEVLTLRATEMLRPKDELAATAVRERTEIVVLDTIGDLASVYSIANVAFVGGSLVKRGGHNPLEPAQFGVPVIMGPSYENFRDIVTRMRDANAICILGGSRQDAAALLKPNDVQDPGGLLYDELVRTLRVLLEDSEEAGAIGRRAREVFEAQQGATKRTVEALVSMVKA